jgi:hypothetical protein
MLISCTNRGCLKNTNALLDLATKDVICQECGQPIANVSESMKRTLKSFGQIVRSAEKKAFMINCKQCHANREVVLDSSNKTVCKICKSPIVVHAAFRQAMEEAGQKLAKLSDLEQKTEDSE